MMNSMSSGDTRETSARDSDRWTRSFQRGGPGGAAFSDVKDLEQATGKAFDEFKLCRISFHTWASVGGITATYRNVIDGTGSWSLGQVAKCIQAAQALISGDTATMHLGAAVNTPTLSVWGCTKPGLGLHAWHPHEASRNILPLRNGTHDHRPCSKHGASCRFTSSNDSMHPSRCSQAVDAQEVANWVLALPG